jgi:hypothetical protein
MGRIGYRLSNRILTANREGWHSLSVKLAFWFTFSVPLSPNCASDEIESIARR